MNDAYHALCGCSQKLTKLTDQRVNKELVYQNRSIKESLTGSSSVPPPPLPPPSPLFFSSLIPIFPSPSLSDSLEEAIGTVEQRGERNDMDSGALEICLVMRENIFNIELICFSFQFFHINIRYKCDRKV